MAAMASCCVSSIHCKPKPFPLFTAAAGGGFPLRSHHRAFSSLAFSTNLSLNRMEWMKAVEKKSSPNARGRSVVCEAAQAKKADSAAKRARQAEKRRVYNKAHKSEIKTRMKKVLEELEVLKKKTEVQPEEILPIEKLIAEAYSAIDKAVKVGTLHRNTGAHRKSRLARRKKAVEIHHGWFSPVASV